MTTIGKVTPKPHAPRHKLRNLAAACALVGLPAACVSYNGFWRREVVSKEAGRDYFNTYGFGDLHETGAPYVLFRVMMDQYPQHLGKDWDEFNAKFGTLPQVGQNLPVGFSVIPDPSTGMEFVTTTCALCHTGELNGKLYEGFGNKKIRSNAIDNAIFRSVQEKTFNKETLLPLAETKAHEMGLSWNLTSSWVIGAAVDALQERLQHRPAVEPDAGPGRLTSFFYFRFFLGLENHPPYSAAKIPALWGFYKRNANGFANEIQGDLAYGMAVNVLGVGSLPDYIFANHNIWQSTLDYIHDLRAPAYPHAINTDLAKIGAELFSQSCARCHGTYDKNRDGRSQYRNRIIPVDVVGTDPVRAHDVTPDLLHAWKNLGVLATQVSLVDTGGYGPPPLDGIWARGPYLHNGSVPTLSDMFRKPAERPKTFYVGGSTPYDENQRLGLFYQEKITADGERSGYRYAADQWLFDTSLPGNGNGGHLFTTKFSRAETAALLEYLKTL